LQEGELERLGSPGRYQGRLTFTTNEIGDHVYDIPVTFNVSSGGCDYAVGDANGNGTFNGFDVTYSVAYFKGGPTPPYSCDCPPHGIWYVAGDVNQSCSFNGLDVIYMVAYFKGGPVPYPCPDCPPSRFGIPGSPTINPSGPKLEKALGR
jgi:hypothetical protein